MIDIAIPVMTATIMAGEKRMTRADAARFDNRRRNVVAGRAVPPDDLAVAGLSGRRVFLFERHRVGGGGRRYHQCRNIAGLACGNADRRCGDERRHFLRPNPSRRDMRRQCHSGRDCRTRRGIRSDTRTLSRNDNAGPRFYRSDASRLAMPGTVKVATRFGMGRSLIRLRLAVPVPVTASRLRRHCMLFLPLYLPIGFPRASGSFRSAIPRANAC